MINVPRNRYWAHMLTLRCNSPCKYCLLHTRQKPTYGTEISGEQVVNFWNSIPSHSGQKLSLIGGEPTLHKDISYILANLKDYNITLTTNLSSKFYNEEFISKLATHSSSRLRVNASFHPCGISAETFIERAKNIRGNGIHLDNIIVVTLPSGGQGSEVNKVRKHFGISASPFTGFYNEEDKFDAPRAPENLYPNETWGGKEAARIGGYRNYDAYRDICAGDKRKINCPNPAQVFMVGPDGKIYGCHYNLYYATDPVGSIDNPAVPKRAECDHYGHCIGCDVPRLGCRKQEIINGVSQ